MLCCVIERRRGGKGSKGGHGGATLADWLHALVPPGGLGRQGNAVIQAILDEPEKASYEGVAAVAAIADVNVGTITRTAQSLGFSGWPDLRLEIRKRFLEHLGSSTAASRLEPVIPVLRSLARDRDNLAAAVGAVDVAAVERIAAAIAAGDTRRIYFVAESTYFAIALALAQTARLIGYDVEAVGPSSLEISNRLPHLGADDVVVIIAHWRYFGNAQQTGKAARERGARAFLISDTRSPDPRSWSAGTVRVPAEGPTFFPSLVPCLSVGQALIAELAALDPDRAAAAIADANAYWRRFGLVHWEE
jgi:DNA-binding MurR/RpiR family transcriptional regulator